MRKVVVYLHSSLDGIVEGPSGAMDIGWIAYDDDLANHSKEVLRTVDTVLWGRNTYLGMYSYWPTVPSNPAAAEHEVEHAGWIDATAKIVFSRTLEKAEWNNSSLVKGNAAEEIAKLKQQPGRDMIVLGSPRFAHSLMRLGFVDEFQLTISPVVLGGGLPLFNDIGGRIDLTLAECRTFDSGVVSLVYRKSI